MTDFILTNNEDDCKCYPLLIPVLKHTLSHNNIKLKLCLKGSKEFFDIRKKRSDFLTSFLYDMSLNNFNISLMINL